MPEMTFSVRWPDGAVIDCYSPSTTISTYFQSGQSYSVSEFVDRAREALNVASERVRQRYGYTCSSALDQMGKIEEAQKRLPNHLREGKVLIINVEPKAGARSSSRAKPSPKHYEVCVIGGGQAGLSISYLLKQEGIEHIVIEKNDVAHSWDKERWDSFCLVTPNYQCRLPGYQYQGGSPNGFMVKDEIVSFLKGYAESFGPPLVTGVGVERLAKTDEGFRIETSAGVITAGQVVVAVGGYHTPKLPAFATKLPKNITQIHSQAYKNPEQLPPGEVLVVGSGQSGCQIVEDLMLAGRKVHLAVGDAPRVARRYRGRDVVEWLEDMGHYDIPIDQMPDPTAARTKTNHYVTGRDGGHDIDLRKFALDGLSLYGSAVDFQDDDLLIAPNLRACLDAADDTYHRINKSIDAFIEERGIEAPPGELYKPLWEPKEEVARLSLNESNITSIVWSIGFAANFSFIEAPVLDEQGHPVHARGVSAVPGLYFLGLPWLHTWGSGRFCGVAQDAEYLLEQVRAARTNQPDVVPHEPRPTQAQMPMER